MLTGRCANVTFTNAQVTANKKLTGIVAGQAGNVSGAGIVENVRTHEDKTYVNIVVHDRKQIAKIIRDLRMLFGFPRISRLAQPVNFAETSKAS
jgi:hypothetical protein